MPVVCRKCGGGHFTLQCGKEKKLPTNKNEDKNEDKNEFSNKNYNNKNYNNKRRNRRYDNDNTPNFRVTLENLPSDITLVNLNKMLINWGRIGNIRIKYNKKVDSNFVNIQFYDKEQAEYFVKAVDKTSIGYMIISASLN